MEIRNYGNKKILIADNNKHIRSIDDVPRKDENGNRNIMNVQSTELVPGDLFEVQDENLAMPCDCILINGTVIVNESMLTGESTPIIKSQIQRVDDNFLKYEE